MNALSLKVFIFVIRKLFTVTDTCHDVNDSFKPCSSRCKKTFTFGWSGAWLLWPDGMTYLQWKKTLRHICRFLYHKK
ncbi:MAG: hypothetical protein WCP39_02260 [Chlamydiota bacterium]